MVKKNGVNLEYHRIKLFIYRQIYFYVKCGVQLVYFNYFERITIGVENKF